MLPVLPLQLHFALDKPTRLPAYPGSLWRSAFGATLRRQVCITGEQTCRGCPLIRRCAYGYLFDTPQPANATGLAAQYKDLPHPYVLSPRLPANDEQAADTATVDLILIGPGRRFLPELLTASANLRLGKTPLAPPQIKLLPPLSRTGAGEPITRAAALEAKPGVPEPPSTPELLRVEFEHPLRLRRNNRYLRPEDFDFATFFTSLTRRISTLYALVKGQGPEADFAGMADTARGIKISASDLHWFDWHRYSARQKTRIPMGGITGSIDLNGNLAPLWPWLWIGQWLHAGKGAVMGLGRYRLETLS